MNSLDLVSRFIEARRAIYPKNFVSGQEVSIELIEKCIENANLAPTHKRTEPWRFIVMRNNAKMRFAQWLEEDYKTQQGQNYSEIGLKKMIEKPLLSDTVVALVMHRHPESGLPEWEEVAAVACAAQNFWLSAAAAGLGTYWSSPSAIERVGGFLRLSENQRCLGFFYLGYYDGEELPPRIRGNFADKVVWLDE